MAWLITCSAKYHLLICRVMYSLTAMKIACSIRANNRSQARPSLCMTSAATWSQRPRPTPMVTTSSATCVPAPTPCANSSRLAYMQGGQKAGSAGGNDTIADAISAIPVGAGLSLTDYNFCEVLPASIQGQVFVDLDFDCIRDAEEQPLSGVKVELLNGNGQVIATTFTDANGQYSFVGLRPGTYSVRETQPDGYFQGGTVAPATGGDVSIDDLIANMVLGSGDAIREANFCEVPPAKISGYVFQAAHRSSPTISTRWTSIRCATVNALAMTSRLARCGCNYARWLACRSIVSRAMDGVYTTQYIEVLTDANGYFEFNGLRAGAYNNLSDATQRLLRQPRYTWLNWWLWCEQRTAEHSAAVRSADAIADHGCIH